LHLCSAPPTRRAIAHSEGATPGADRYRCAPELSAANVIIGTVTPHLIALSTKLADYEATSPEK
jgi:hypothetical protein